MKWVDEKLTHYLCESESCNRVSGDKTPPALKRLEGGKRTAWACDDAKCMAQVEADTVALLEPSKARTFDSGATRDTDEGKYDYEGFLAPGVLERYAAYMHEHRTQSDGELRDSDNWQKGIPRDQYMKSMFRHFMDLWLLHRGGRDDVIAPEETLCALMFNVMGYLFELQQGR